jgi:uncharacterized protein YqjF (DUF2071 family)
MLNYEVAPALLEPLVPRGTELDTWNSRTYVSLVGFLFDDTRVLGFPIPGHQTFEEVNLRFYVRRETAGDVRRGVTFIREVVPRHAIAIVARALYNEPYVALPMTHTFTGDAGGAPRQTEYRWRSSSGWISLKFEARGEGAEVAAGSQEEFITEHYWGYTRQRDGSTVEYRVDHPRWRVWNGRAALTGDLTPVYGERFAALVREPPVSAFIADGSAVVVHFPSRGLV